MRCNICGVPESEWTDGTCSACGMVCNMIDSVILPDTRIFAWAEKHGCISGGRVSKERIIDYGRSGRPMPKYVLDYINLT